MRVGSWLLTVALALGLLAGGRRAVTAGVAPAREHDERTSGATADANDLVTIEGRLLALASSVRFEPGRASEPPALSLMIETRDGRISVTLAAGARVTGADGEPVEAGRLRLGVRLALEGRWLGAAQFEASSVTALP